MGNSSSSGHEEEDPLDPFDGIDTLGYRVLGVQPNSPAAAAGLVSFLDFLVGCDEKMLLGSGEDLEPGQEYDDIDLPALLEENKGKELEFLVWNIKSQTARLVKLTPSDTWGGAGLLGVTIRLDNYAGAEDRLVRILTAEPNSPAAVAGLVAEQDFLLGTTHQTLDNVDRMAALLRQHVDEIVELYVYNSKTDMVRVVALMPTLSWGGPGLLGAEVGTGYLHRLPAAARATAGVSVERKVRYVNNTNESGKAPIKNGGMLELEPQLEMEPGPDDDDDDDEVESVALETPEQTHRKAAPAAVAPAPASTSAISSPRRAPLSGTRAPSSGGLEPKEVQAIFDKPPPPAVSTLQNAVSAPARNEASKSEQLEQLAAPRSEASFERQVPQPDHHQAAAPQMPQNQVPLQQQYPAASQQYPGQQQYQARKQNPYPVPQQGYPVSSAAPVNSYASGVPPAATSTPPLNSYASAPVAAFPPLNSTSAAPPANSYAASAASLAPPPQGYYGAGSSGYAQSYGNTSTATPSQQYGQQTPAYSSSYAAAPPAAMYGSAPLPPPPMAEQKPPPMHYGSSAPGSASLPPPPTMLQHSTSR